VHDWTEDINRGPWVGDIDAQTAQNRSFRTVLSTGRHTQLTVMCVKPGEDVGREVHQRHDQFLRIVEGRGRVELGPNENEVEQTQQIRPGWAVIVPAGIWHNVVNTGEGDLKLYSLYSPPVHLDGTIHQTKADAEAAERIERALR
jgi:mannose-6-phosphate isomerase-like protein (cupin superfamily)